MNVKMRIKKELRTAGYIFDNEISMIGLAFQNSNDEYIKERFSDIKDIGNKS